MCLLSWHWRKNLLEQSDNFWLKLKDLRPLQKMFFYVKVYSQNAPVVLLLIHLVGHIQDEDTEVFHRMVVNNVTHIGNQNGLLHSVLEVHEKPAKMGGTIAGNPNPGFRKEVMSRTTRRHLSLAFMTSSMLEKRKCMSDWLSVLNKTGLRRKCVSKISRLL